MHSSKPFCMINLPNCKEICILYICKYTLYRYIQYKQLCILYDILFTYIIYLVKWNLRFFIFLEQYIIDTYPCQYVLLYLILFANSMIFHTCSVLYLANFLLMGSVSRLKATIVNTAIKALHVSEYLLFLQNEFLEVELLIQRVYSKF